MRDKRWDKLNAFADLHRTDNAKFLVSFGVTASEPPADGLPRGEWIILNADQEQKGRATITAPITLHGTLRAAHRRHSRRFRPISTLHA